MVVMLGVHDSVKSRACSRWDSVSSRVKSRVLVRRLERRILSVMFPLRIAPVFLLVIVFASGTTRARTEPTVEELKARVPSANVGDKAKICVEIAEKQLAVADKEYTSDEIEKAQTSLTDVVSYSELARDYSIQSHKHQKQTEIAIRSMTRKLNDLLHVVGREEQGPLKDAISHLERVRDDLLAAMFPKGAK